SRAISDCCSVGGIALMPPCSPRSSKSRVTSSTNRGTPPGRSVTLSITSFGSACPAASSPTMGCTSSGLRGQRDHAVMAAHIPRRPKFRPSGEENEQRCPRTSFGNAAQKVERGRIGPMEVFHHYHRWLSPCARHPPIGKRRQLPASQFFRRQSQPA